MEWFDAKKNLPAKSGDYLCVVRVIGNGHTYYVQEVNHYWAPNHNNQLGWFENLDKFGCYKNDLVIYWMPLPKLPEELKRG